MALLRGDGGIQYVMNGVTYIKYRNAKADMSEIKSAHKRKFIIDKSKLTKREIRKLERIQERMLMRAQIAEIFRTR